MQDKFIPVEPLTRALAMRRQYKECIVYYFIWWMYVFDDWDLRKLLLTTKARDFTILCLQFDL